MQDEKRSVTVGGQAYALTIEKTGIRSWRASGKIKLTGADGKPDVVDVHGIGGRSIDQAIEHWENRAKGQLGLS